LVDDAYGVADGVFDVGVVDAVLAGGVRDLHLCRLPCPSLNHILKRSGLRHSAGVPISVRPAGPADGDFLAEMFVAAAFWRLDGPRGDLQSILTRPELAHYVSAWPRPGDLGVVAEDGPPVGAAWLRLMALEPTRSTRTTRASPRMS
jgi:hypothetical protein